MCWENHISFLSSQHPFFFQGPQVPPSSMNGAISWGSWFPFAASTPHGEAYFSHVKLNMLSSILISSFFQEPSRRGATVRWGGSGPCQPGGRTAAHSTVLAPLFGCQLPSLPWPGIPPILLLWTVCHSGHPDGASGDRMCPLFHTPLFQGLWRSLTF